jgi:hypothetical protein
MERVPEDLSTSELLEHLPPIKHAPILKELGRLGLESFKLRYALTTPTLPNGIVDHEKLVANVSALVSSDYRWRAPFFDEHHLHWEGRWYDPERHDGNTIPHQFRELNIHKLWVPREFHNFIHAVTLPPVMPSMEVMAESIDAYRHKEYMYTISSEVITLRERTARAIPLPRRSDNEPRRVRDPLTKRIVIDGLYEARRQEFVEVIEDFYHNNLPPDLVHLSQLPIEEVTQFEEVIPSIRRELKESIAIANNRRRGRAVRLLIERPQRDLAKSGRQNQAA